MKSLAVVFTLALLACGLPARPTLARGGKGKRAATPATGCADGKCHQRVLQQKPLHGPVAAGRCQPCHVAKRPIKGRHGPGAFKRVKGNGPCLSCHKEIGKAMAKGKVHPPVTQKGCVSCHRPHGGGEKFHLKSKSVKAQCTSCHKQRKKQFAFTHGPMAVGACTFCHSPHASPHKPLLVADGNKLCFRCHEAARFKPKFRHAALDEGCPSCHASHGSDHKFFVRAAPGALCAECHEEVLEKAKKAKVKHAAMNDKAGCVSCHQPHGGKFGHLLKNSQVKVCSSCHPTQHRGKYKHEPVADGDCTACHQPHGGQRARMLKQPFPKEFYGAFSEKRYQLCFECHESDITKDRYTTTLTGFRQGKINLHYLHVVAPGNNRRKGRSCKACHEVHAGPQAKHIREKVPFGSGGWKLPVTFTPKKNGGRCQVGCHSPKTYDRTVKN